MKAQKLGVLGRPEQGQEERGEESIIFRWNKSLRKGKAGKRSI